jgi:hypothetical protein
MVDVKPQASNASEGSTITYLSSQNKLGPTKKNYKSLQRWENHSHSKEGGWNPFWFS